MVKHFILILFLLSAAITSPVQKVLYNENKNSVSIDVLEQTEDYVILKYSLNYYELKDVNYSGYDYLDIILDDEPDFIIKGSPKVPHVNRSIIIPDNAGISVEVINSDYSALEDIQILPSKGNPKRNMDIRLIPYIKGNIYNINAFFPSTLVDLHDPYILRDFRGQTIQFNPFSYNPVSRVLKIYNEIVIKVTFEGINTVNQLLNRDINKKIVYDYHNLYQDHFLNYQTYLTRYNPIPEDGEMLVICYDSFCDDMQPFVDWKNQKGLKTTLVPKADAGDNVSSISNYVENFYNSHDLTYLLLVGDKNQIPTIEIGSGYSDGESDISYAYISGNDSYPEFFVGRFSAQNTGHVQTEVERTIEYERDPQLNANWYTKGLMIASNEGAGAGHDGGEADWEHARNMRDDLLDYTYTDIDEMYDGSHGGEDSNSNPSNSMVRNAINNGLGIIHYTGHGETAYWVTSYFDTDDVNSLTNNNELPFICTVGCKSGDFGGTCLGEVFTYATSNNGEPTGAIATFMSTIYQGWAPPMEAQDEMVDILVENYSNNRKFTFGGISWNGCLKMNDSYGSSGYDETDHWVLFGDPSVVLRTSAPSSLSINHSGSLDPSEGAYEVLISGDYDNVLASLSYNGIFLGSSYAENGVAIIVINNDISSYDELTLTVTGYNTTTVIETVLTGDSCPGYTAGDLTGDSTTNVVDIVTLVSIILGQIDANNCQIEYGDLNNDGIFNVTDIILIINIIIGN